MLLGYDVPMTKLTQKQENFCAAYIETGNASEAYRRAYDASRMKPESISVKASELMRNGGVTVRIAELRAATAQRHQLTVDDLLNELEEARSLAMMGKRPQCGAAVNATLGKAKLLGYLDKKPDGNEAEMARMLSDLINKLPG